MIVNCSCRSSEGDASLVLVLLSTSRTNKLLSRSMRLCDLSTQFSFGTGARWTSEDPTQPPYTHAYAHRKTYGPDNKLIHPIEILRLEIRVEWSLFELTVIGAKEHRRRWRGLSWQMICVDRRFGHQENIHCFKVASSFAKVYVRGFRSWSMRLRGTLLWPGI